MKQNMKRIARKTGLYIYAAIFVFLLFAVPAQAGGVKGYNLPVNTGIYDCCIKGTFVEKQKNWNIRPWVKITSW